jgi:hypothetical protein
MGRATHYTCQRMQQSVEDAADPVKNNEGPNTLAIAHWPMTEQHTSSSSHKTRLAVTAGQAASTGRLSQQTSQQLPSPSQMNQRSQDTSTWRPQAVSQPTQNAICLVSHSAHGPLCPPSCTKQWSCACFHASWQQGAGNKQELVTPCHKVSSTIQVPS